METHPRAGVVKEEEFPNSRKPFHRQVYGEFWNIRGQHNWEGKTKNTDDAPNSNCQQRSSPEAHVHHQQAGDGQGSMCCIIGA